MDGFAVQASGLHHFRDVLRSITADLPDLRQTITAADVPHHAWPDIPIAATWNIRRQAAVDKMLQEVSSLGDAVGSHADGMATTMNSYGQANVDAMAVIGRTAPDVHKPGSLVDPRGGDIPPAGTAPAAPPQYGHTGTIRDAIFEQCGKLERLCALVGLGGVARLLTDMVKATVRDPHHFRQAAALLAQAMDQSERTRSRVQDAYGGLAGKWEGKAAHNHQETLKTYEKDFNRLNTMLKTQVDNDLEREEWTYRNQKWVLRKVLLFIALVTSYYVIKACYPAGERLHRIYLVTIIIAAVVTIAAACAAMPSVPSY
ncbi:WXG100 family type VII secretion target [Nonomuraea sp. NPDC048916]|uniref:WXG100 family type VII secretion target n=1 Tax=Nonomuraea sp. NPDC048916 TaxID=3154232 RepID=UPI0033EB5937